VKITRNQLKEMIRQALSELKEGGKGSGRPAKPGGAKDIENKMMSAADAANAKMDAAEKAMKKKKIKKEGGPGSGRKGGFDVGGPAYPNVPKGAKSTKQARKMLKKKKVKEGVNNRVTVKEVKLWMKTLEENRYKKTYNSDARRVSWMVNHMGESLDNMPMSMKKKWSKAQYGRERYLAKEFIKSQKAKVNEIALRDKIRNIILNSGRLNGLQ
jgi:hypothetical protein